MKKLPVLFAVALFGTMAIQATRADQHDPIIVPPEYRPSAVLGWFYANACRGLNGEYVNNNPTFYQSFSCEGIDWCVERPETYGCNYEGSIVVKPLSYSQLKGMMVPATRRVVYREELF